MGFKRVRQRRASVCMSRRAIGLRTGKYRVLRGVQGLGDRRAIGSAGRHLKRAQKTAAKTEGISERYRRRQTSLCIDGSNLGRA